MLLRTLLLSLRSIFVSSHKEGAFLCRCTILTCALASTTLTAAKSEDDLNRGDNRDAPQLHSDMLSARRAIRSGIFRAKGKKHVKYRSNVLDGDVDAFCAFDFSRDRFRYDNAEPTPLVIHRGFPVEHNGEVPRERQTQEKSEPFPEASLQPAVHLVEMKGIRTPSHTIEWYRFGSDAWNDVVIGPPERSFSNASMHHPFDVRGAGLMGIAAFQEGRAFDQICGSYPAASALREESERANCVALVWRDDVATIRLELSLAHGCAPIRREVFHSRSTQYARDGSPPQWSEATWEEVNGVFVPTYMKVLRRNDSHEAVCSYSLVFDWEIVNEAVPEALFSYKSFSDIPNGTYVRDARTSDGVAIEVDRIGYEPVRE